MRSVLSELQPFLQETLFLPQSVDLTVLSQWHDCLRLRVWKNMLSFGTKTVKEYAIFSYIRTVSGPIANRYISMDVFHCSCGTIGSTRMGQKRGLGEIMGTRGKSSAILVTSCSVCKDDLSLFYLFFCSCQPLSHHWTVRKHSSVNIMSCSKPLK